MSDIQDEEDGDYYMCTDFGEEEIEVDVDHEEEDEIERVDLKEEDADFVRQKEIEEIQDVYNPTSQAQRRLCIDIREMRKSDSKANGFIAEPRDGNIMVWDIKLFGFDKKDPMYRDLQEYNKRKGKDYVLMEMRFPENYPHTPPFIRVVEPRFMPHTGRVTAGGSICTDLLTKSAWNPAYTIESILVNVSSQIFDGKARIDFSNPEPYSLGEARNAFSRVASDHGWKVFDWLPS